MIISAPAKSLDMEGENNDRRLKNEAKGSDGKLSMAANVFRVDSQRLPNMSSV